MFLVFKKKQKVAETAVDPQQSDPVLVNREVIIPDQSTLPKYVTGNTSIAKGEVFTIHHQYQKNRSQSMFVDLCYVLT